MKRGPHPFTALLATAMALAAWAHSASARDASGRSSPAVAPVLSNASTVEIAPGVNGLTATAWHQADAATEAKVSGWTDQLRSGWIPNLGQITDTGGHGAPNILYTTSVRGAQVYVTTTGISQYFFAHDDDVDADAAGPAAKRGARKPAAPAGPIRWCRVDLDLKGAAIRPDHVRLEDPLYDQGATNYYLPHCPAGVLDVPTYGKVTFLDVYPGIDWVVLSKPGEGVHHDFIVHPGADASRIRLQYTGARSIELSDDRRALRIRTPLGEVREGALNCWQGEGRQPIGARFRVDGNVASLLVEPYDHAAPLVIDPPLVWSTYYGGSNSYDGPRTIYCDNVNDDVYVVGYTASTNLPLQNLAGAFYQGTIAGNQDAFIWKFSQLGVRKWATYYGGTGIETGEDCTLDASGNLYVCGYTTSTDFPTQALGGAYNQPASGGGGDGFIVEFNAAGVRQWATYYGGDGSDQATGITTDASGKVYVCGVTGSTNLPLANPGGGAYFQTSANGSEDAFVLRFSPLGVLEWGTYFGGKNGLDEAYGITTSPTSVYVTGYTQSAFYPTLNPGGGAYFQGALAGDQDVFISRFTLAGVQTWSTYYGGDGTDYGDEPVVDANGNLFVVGYTNSANFPTVNPGGTAYYQPALAGEHDLFILKFSSSGSTLWATYYGGTSYEFLEGGAGKPITLDAQGRVYVTGMTQSSDFPVLNPGAGSYYQGANAGFRDAILGQFTNTGTMLWSTYFGSNQLDFGTSVSISSHGCLFATGESVGAGNLTTVNPGLGAYYQPANAGFDDGYIAKFCSPSSACCVDFTCVAVESQSQCTALGGTAFFPNQPCSTTVCNTLCKICGRKFSDVNRNGVQDNGEPGLANWTIQLVYPNGTLYAAITTDAQGNYCFNNIPCGAWEVTEVQQPNSVQTFPAPAVHTLNLGTGTTQNAVDFGNYVCTSTVGCFTWPAGLAAWWPFNDTPGPTTASDATHLSPPRNVAQLVGAAASGGSAPGVICVATAADYARVPNANQLGLQFAGGPFAIAAWLNPASSTAGARTIVEKRVLLSASAHETRGWALYLDGLQSYLEIGTGGTPQVVAGPVLAGDVWSHLAVSVDRATGHGQWYLNGSPVPTFDFTPISGLVSCTADLYIGRVSPAFGTSSGFQGCIGDLALFATPLSAATVSKAAATGPGGWCPESALLPAVTTLCKTQTSAQVCLNISNNYGTPQSYTWSFAGLPAGPGCSVAGPTVFSPSGGTVIVPPGISPPICVSIARPLGLTAQNATACFGLTFVNNATGTCRTTTATLRADNSCWCVTPQQATVVSVPARASGAVIGIGVGHPCDPATLAYRLSAVWLDPDHEDPLELSLDGLAPGTPVTGTVTAGPGADQQLAVTASLPNGYDPAARYEIVLEADTDGDGIMERLCGTLVAATYDSTERVGVPAGMPAQRSAVLLASPNPFLGGSTIAFTLAAAEPVELGVYDLSGRLVRSLERGLLTAGPHRFDWNGRDDGGRRAAAGIYFVHLDGPGRHLQAKLVKLQ